MVILHILQKQDSVMSQKWKEGTKKFIQISANQTSNKMAVQQRAYSESPPHNVIGMVPLSKTKSETSAIRPKGLTPFRAFRQQKKPDHTFRNFLLFISVCLVCVFIIDIVSEVRTELNRLEIKRKQCHEDYQNNECHNSVEVLKQKCNDLQHCFMQSAEDKIRYLKIITKLMGENLKGFIGHSQIQGAVFFIVMVGLVLFFVYKMSHSKVTQKLE